MMPPVNRPGHRPALQLATHILKPDAAGQFTALVVNEKS